ncbi:MAG TPA: hypothetical protein VNG12_26900 [Acidimicrobiales bacterium]|nr:hypothetical protein [Acidimicrobiales bacterium]
MELSTAALLLTSGLEEMLSLDRVPGGTAGHRAATASPRDTVCFVQGVTDRLEP